MHCKNENRFGYFFYLPYCSALDDNEVHRCIIFNDIVAMYLVCVIFVIKYITMLLDIDAPMWLVKMVAPLR